MEVLALVLLVGLFLFVLALISGTGLFWMPWPLLGLGFVFLIPVLGLLVVFAPFIAVVAIAKAVFSRPAKPPKTLPSATPSAMPRPEYRDGDRRSVPQSGTIGEFLAEGETKIDAMRSSARRIPKPEVRARALDVCATADRVLALLRETDNEQLVRDVVARYLTPGETIVSRYARLATHGVASAEQALSRVEEEDLPLIERKLSELYDRLHRDDLIDLKVASEMLEFGMIERGRPKDASRQWQ